MKRVRRSVGIVVCALALSCFGAAGTARAAMQDLPVVKLQSLDKVTARTMTFEAKVGSTVKFGPLYIRIQACRKAPPIEQPESSAFLQIWEVPRDKKPAWVFSGWMFASSPSLSAMDHPIYDVWVLDCLDPVAEAQAAAEAAAAAQKAADAGNGGAQEEEVLDSEAAQ